MQPNNRKPYPFQTARNRFLSIMLAIIKIRFVAFRRLLQAEWPTYCVMGPLMIVVAFLFIRRILRDFSIPIPSATPHMITHETMIKLIVLAILLKIIFSFFTQSRALYPTASSVFIEDMLPIPHSLRYLILYFTRLITGFPFMAGLSALLIPMGIPSLICGFLLVYLALPGIEMGFILTLIRLYLRQRPLAVTGLCTFILTPLLLPENLLSLYTGLTVTLLFIAGYWGFVRWRHEDGERLDDLLAPPGWIAEGIRRLLRPFPWKGRPLLTRDLLLTVRNFAPALWRNLILAGMIVGATVVRGGISPIFLTAFAAFILSTTALSLFTLEKPFRPFDNTLPIIPSAIWQTKVYYALLMVLPTPFLVWGIEMAASNAVARSPADAVALLFRLVLVALAVAAVTGGSIGEGDQKTALQYIMAAFTSLLCALFIGVFHPLMIVLIFPLLSYLQEAAVRRLSQEEV